MLDGGYLIWSLPGHRVFVDGRMEAYPPEVLRASRQADLFGDYEAIFRDYGITPEQAVRRADSLMQAMPAWSTN